MVLAVAAILILALGVALRPREAAPPPVSESERAQLQALAQRQSLQRHARVMEGYARDLAPSVLRVRQNPEESSYREPRPGELLILVASQGTGDPRWITAEYGGRQRLRCGRYELEELAVTAVIPSSLEQAVAFGMNENVAGVVVRCRGRLALVAPEHVTLAAAAEREDALWTCCGVRLEPTATGGRSVEAVRTGSRLEAAGLEPGDVVPNDVNLQTAMSFNVRRGDEEVMLTVPPPPTPAPMRLRRTPRGAEVLALPPDAPAARLGLRTGDIVLRANGTDRPRPVEVERAAADPENARLVVLRGDEKVLLEKAP